MASKAKMHLIAILLGALIITGLAKEHPGKKEFGRFFTYYYLNPQPDKAPKMLKKFFESERFTNEKICDAHCQDITAYFFARIAQLEPKLIENYKLMFENGTHKQRLFLLKILQLCGNQDLKMFFTSRLDAGRFINQRKQIKQVLEKAIPIDFDALSIPVTEAGDLDFLWVEFRVTGSREAVVKIIKSLDQDSSSAESLLLAGAAKWSLVSNCKEHKRVFEICKEELSKASGIVKNALQEVVAEFEKSGAEHQSTKVEKERLEARAKELLKKDDVSLREDIDEIFSLADIYAEEGNDKKAIALYQKALKVDSWRLEYQLKLAKLLRKNKVEGQAVNKAKFVYQYAEDGNLIQDAENLLEELGIKLSMETKAEEQQIADKIQIVIVPAGEVDKRLLHEIKEELQMRMGIKYSISEIELELGKIDRSYADKYLAKIVDRIKSNFPQKNIKQLLSELDIKETDWGSYDGKVKFVEGFFHQIGYPDEQIEEFHNRLKEYHTDGQYDASRLQSDIAKRFKIPKGSNIRGYLGITGKDIFTMDFNFLYGWARSGYGVMSYHRFKADFNNERPDRRRLLKRCVKQGISSSFFILGISRCTTPTCARAYPHSLAEHDQKEIEICSWCREQLNSIINKNK